MGLWDKVFGRSKSTSYSQEQDSHTEQSSQTTGNAMLAKIGEQMMGQAQQMATTPFMPNRGVRVAAFQPGQQQAFNMSNQMLNSMGFNPVDYLSGMPDTETIGGLTGYTTGDAFDANMAATDPEGIYANLMSDKMFRQKKATAPAAAPADTGPTVADPAALAQYFAKLETANNANYGTGGNYKMPGNVRKELDNLYAKAYGKD